MTDEKIIERVRKLLALSKSDNANEAAAAAKQAQILMTRHQIDEAIVELDASEPDEPVDSALLHAHSARARGQLPAWKHSLATIVAEVNQCHAFRGTGTPRIHIVGRPSDCNTVRYLFMFFVEKIDEACRTQAKLRGNPGRTWANNFRRGAVSTLCARLREAEAEARAAVKQEAFDGDTLGSGAALVRVNTAIAKLDERKQAADEFAERKFSVKPVRFAGVTYDPDAYRAGQRAGERIDIERGGRAGLSSGAKRSLP